MATLFCKPQVWPISSILRLLNVMLCSCLDSVVQILIVLHVVDLLTLLTFYSYCFLNGVRPLEGLRTGALEVFKDVFKVVLLGLTGLIEVHVHVVFFACRIIHIFI